MGKCFVKELGLVRETEEILSIGQTSTIQEEGVVLPTLRWALFQARAQVQKIGWEGVPTLVRITGSAKENWSRVQMKEIQPAVISL